MGYQYTKLGDKSYAQAYNGCPFATGSIYSVVVHCHRCLIICIPKIGRFRIVENWSLVLGLPCLTTHHCHGCVMLVSSITWSRSIFSMKNILFRMGISINTIYDKMEDFIAQFQLTNKNLYVRPRELNLLCYSLLHLFTAKDENLLPHDQLVDMLAGSFSGDKEKVQEYLVKVMEIADNLHEESLNTPS